MEVVVANLSGRVRRATMHGREYLVAPMTLIVEGVLNGSRGPLYYPRSEVEKDPSRWNHLPLVLYHPERDGKLLSARDPAVYAASGLGTVYNATAADGKLVAEGWFDVEATRAADSVLLAKLEAGEPVELSTGLGVEEVDGKGIHNGTEYRATAVNYVPDHVAVLPGQKGACSVRDGCGVLVNESGEVAVAVSANADYLLMHRLHGKLFPQGGGRVEHAADGLVVFTRDGKTYKHGYTQDDKGEVVLNDGEPVEVRQIGSYYRRPRAAGEATVGDGMTANAWSDAAREAAAAARAAKAGHLHSAAGAESDVAEASSDHARVSGTSHAHYAASAAHAAAAREHGKVAHGVQGSDLHRAQHEAARHAHAVAAEEHYNEAKRLQMAGNTGGVMNREQTIAWLVANCDCWKDGKADLEKVADATLDRLRKRREQEKETEAIVNAVKAKGRTLIANADGEVDLVKLAKFLGVETNPAQDPAGWIKEMNGKIDALKAKLSGEAAAEDAADKGTDDAMENPDGTLMAGNKGKVKPPVKPQTANEWLAAAPPEVQSVVRNAMASEHREKAAMVQQLVANVREDARQALGNLLMSKPVEELRSLLLLAPAQTHVEPVLNFFGAAGGPASPKEKDDSDNVLPVFNCDFTEMASPKLRGKTA